MKKLFIALVLGLFLVSCGKEATTNTNDTKGAKTAEQNQSKEALVTSIPPLKWLVEKIAGDSFTVISIVKPNMNHELFEPKPNDLKTLENSKLYFTYNALNFEDKITDTLNNKDKVTLVLDGIDKNLLLENHHHHDHDHEGEHKDEHKHEEHHHDEAFDPHVWFSLEIMPKVAENIKNKLVATYPDKKETFEKNYNAFLQELEGFKKEMAEKISTKTKKHFMIYHPALEYFLHPYGIEEVEVEQDGKEPSAKQIQEIIDEAKEHGITTILVQPQFPKQSIEAISKEIPNSKVLPFNTDEENVFDNLRKLVDNLQ